MNLKIKKLGKDIEKKLANIIFMESKDLREEYISITGVEVTSDLSFAKVYFISQDKEEALKKLKHAKGFLRKKLSQEIDVRHTPELIFVYDESIEYGENIERILEDIKKKA